MDRVSKILFLLSLFILSNLLGQNFSQKHKNNFLNPPPEYWPSTRWWWPGNATTKENITYELEQMNSHGIKGVEQITMQPFYERGNIKYLSEQYFDLIKHAVSEANRLKMEVSFNFGGPGWIIGGEWITDDDKSRDMIPTCIDVKGPQNINMELPKKLIKTERSWEIFRPELVGGEKLLAVVAGKLVDGVIEPTSLIVLTNLVEKNNIKWSIPDGEWRISCFWLSIDKTHNTVDHFNREAMQRYCDYLGGKYREAIGEEFGRTVKSFFCDSFELPYQPSGIKWSDGLLSRFHEEYNYDLVKYLPAIWWDVEGLTPKIRYDVNEFLANMGIESFYEPFLNWCKKNSVKGRIQTYGFETDNIRSAGLADIPEMEITPGEKDQHPWYDTRIGPKKYVASGAHIYGKKVVSVEAHTFLHWERYRATLEEIKISTDGFLRSGANKFYNHGFSSSMERDLAPSRRMPWAPQINPTNVWWKYYPLLAEYTARCSYLLRQGNFVGDIAVYSPLANQWTKNVLNARRWTRDFDWGELGDLLISNGYDFDLLNDDAIQNIAEFNGNIINVGAQNYQLLILPNIESLPLQTMYKLIEYVEQGGILIALDRLPESSTGFIDHKINDEKITKRVSELFGDLSGNSIEHKQFGKGKVYYLKSVIHRPIWWDKYSSILDPFIKILNKCILPDFSIDFAYEEIRKNEGLTFLHREIENADVYFVTNIQDKSVNTNITFRVDYKQPWIWDPYNGSTNMLYHYSLSKKGITLPVRLNPWESTIIVFKDEPHDYYVGATNVHKINFIEQDSISADVQLNGSYFVTAINKSGKKIFTKEIDDLPSSLILNGKWELTLGNKYFQKIEKEIYNLISWSNSEDTKYFSGTGEYSLNFELDEEYIKPNLNLLLDLGKMGNVGEVFINGNNAGTIWMKGQKCDITEFVKKGKNELIIQVTNTNINRVSSFKAIVPVPKELEDKLGKAKEDVNIPREFGFEPLPPSGLMGPVKIIPVRNFGIKFD